MNANDEIDLTSAEEALRAAVRFGDAKDVKDAFALLLQELYAEIDAVAAKRLGAAGVVTTAEVLDRASARAYNQLVDFAEKNATNTADIVASIPGVVIHFMEGDISFKQFVLSIIGSRYHGVVGELLRVDFRHRSLAHQYMKGGAPNPLNNAALVRFSRSETQDVIDTKARSAALNEAMTHLPPKERLALALRFGIGIAAFITSERHSPRIRVALLRYLAMEFGFDNDQAELLSLRFQTKIETEGVFGTGSKGGAAASDGMQQKDIATLLGLDAPGASRLLARAKGQMETFLKNHRVFSA